MSIGEQIIAAIADNNLIRLGDPWRDVDGKVVIECTPNAAEQLEAVVEAHIEEQVRVRIKEIMSHDTHQESIDAARKIIEGGPVDPKSQPWYPTD